jgi:molybdopterin molybdotransferase
MISFKEALSTVLSSARYLPTERVGIAESAGRVLAEDVASDMDMPPFDKSAMDGYACKRADLGRELIVIETIPAGKVPQRKVEAGQCSKIMTGAPVPEGADCVIMKEYVEEIGEDAIVFVGESTRDNNCLEGEDVRSGDIVIAAGTVIGGAHIAVMASVGCAEPLVSCKPRVGIIATGSELVEPGEKPGAGQIRNSNSYQLAAQVERSGAIARNYGIAEDSEEETSSAIQKGLAENDVLIVSGGVSVGDFDLVRGILRDNGVDLMFEKVAVKPGRPTVFGVTEKSYVFGLPGNPVSTFILFEIMVRPFLYKLMGCDKAAGTISAILDKSISRKKFDRDSWIPVFFTEGGLVRPVDYHGSAHINAMCEAAGLLCMPKGTAELVEGANVAVRLI